MRNPHETRPDEAYLTFLTGNQEGYVAGVLTLQHSLRKAGCTRPLVVMHISDVPEPELEFLRSAGVALKLVPSLPNPNCKGSKGRPCQRGRDNYSKLAAFNMTEYQTLIYLDSDTLVRAAIDELFCHTSFAGSRIFTCPPGDTSCTKLNSGIMVIKPNRELYNDMMGKYMRTPSWNNGDQGFLTYYYNVAGAPHREYVDNRVYNVKVKIRDKKPCDEEMRRALGSEQVSTKAKVMHFMDATKPWNYFLGQPDMAIVMEPSAMDNEANKRFQGATECFVHGLQMWKRHFLGALQSNKGLKAYLEKRHSQNGRRGWAV